MNLELTEEQQLLQASVREFAEGVVRPHAAHIDQTGEFPRDTFAKAGELGLAGVAVPAEWGGSGMDTVSYAIVIEEISRVCANMGVILSVNNSLVCDPIEKFGNEDQKKRFLVPLARGREARLLRADRARRRLRRRQPEDAGDSRGRRLPDLGPEGVHHLRLGRRRLPPFRDDEPGEEDQGDLGVPRGRRRPRGSTARATRSSSGVNASGTVEIFLTDVRVPAADRLGQEGDGFKIAMSTLDGGRIGIAAQAVGIAEEALEAAVRYAKARKAFGRPIADFQALRFYLADMATEVDAARLLTRKAAAAKDEAKKNGGRYSMEAAIAKLYAAEMAQRVTTKALQIHGGYGYTKEYPVERNFRDARITEIYEGTSEIHRLIIAREIFRDAGLAIG